MRYDSCPEAGVLRSYLDRELDEVAAERVQRHLSGCAGCRLRFRETQLNARRISELLQPAEQTAAAAAAQQAKAWEALQRHLSPGAARPSATGQWAARADRIKDGRTASDIPPASWAAAGATSATRHWWHRLGNELGGIWNMFMRGLSIQQRAAVAAGLLAVMLVGVLMMPAGQAAAIGFLSLFRPQKLAPVTIDPTRPFDPLKSLEGVSKVTVPQQSMGRGTLTTAPLSEVSAKAGITIRKPASLPAGFTEAPQVRVTQAVESSLVLDKQKADAYLKANGSPNATMPAKLDGAKLIFRIPAIVTLTYLDKDGSPRLVIAEVATPSASVEGNASATEIRDFLLGLPGLPPETVAQLRGMNDWMQTLPIPVPKDRSQWRETTINGASALIIADKTAGGGGIVWLKDGVVTAITGLLTEKELTDVAASMR